MIETSDINRPPREWIEAISKIGAATCSSQLARTLGDDVTHALLVTL